MNRWRQRLAELHADGAEQASAPFPDAQNVHNGQNHQRAAAFEHSEQIEQPTGTPAGLATAADRAAAIWDEAEEERAAIVEYDGDVLRAWAEGFARLDPDHPPGDVLPKRWLTFVNDVGRFLDSDFCGTAAALGWGPLNLFGCDRERPFARIDHAGLLWLLNGDRLVDLDRHRAVIEKSTGALQGFRRRPVAVGEVVLAWELVDGSDE